MRISVTVKTGKRERKVIEKSNDEFEVWVKARPVKGAANKELIKILANYFGVKKSQILLVSGLTSFRNIMEISS